MDEDISICQYVWMMGKLGLLAVCVLAAAAGVAWLYYSPIPPGIADQDKLRGMFASLKVLYVITSIGEMLGYSGLNISRKTIEYSFSSLQPDSRVTISNAVFDGVGVQIYRPADKPNDEQLPALVYYHGGGWVTFTAESYKALTSYLAGELGWLVVSVDYRLSPENPYPAPFEDCLNATLHLLRNPEKYHIDNSYVGVAGDSAGGNMATAVALKLSEIKNIPSIKFQGLFYPALQSFDFRLPSFLNNDNSFLSTSQMIGFWSMYFNGRVDNLNLFLKNQHTSDKLKAGKIASFVSRDLLPARYLSAIPKQDISFETDPALAESFEAFLLDKFANPLMAENLNNLPPTFVLTCEYDVLRDEGILYANRLTKAGVRVKHSHYESGYHGFLSFFNHKMESSLCRKVTGEFVDWLQEDHARYLSTGN